MIYPATFEKKIGFADIRTLLKGRCMSTLGTEWVDSRVGFSSDRAEIVEELARAQEFAAFEADEEDVYEEAFFDVRQALLRIRPERTNLEEGELFDLKRSLKTVLKLVDFFLGRNADDEEEGEEAPYPALRRMSEDVPTYAEVIAHIEEVLNKYGKVKDTASPALLTTRHEIEVGTRSISHNLRQLIQKAQQEGLMDRDVAPTLRDGRLVIPVAASLKKKIGGIVHDESATGKTVFVEPTSVVEANNRIRELKAAERREVQRILQQLTAEVRVNVDGMLASLRYLAHIDYLRALSIFSESFDSIVPEVVDGPHIDWKNARHPLLEQTLKRSGGEAIPLDVSLRGGKRILLISGPNAGGKSVCLKTIGLLQYMLQCGMPVPMDESSTMGIFDDIFLSIGDEQDMDESLSTYSSHLLGLKEMMRKAGGRSLLLIDEFGSGTEPEIGGALAEGILKKFVEIGTWGVITTHYQNLKLFGEKESAIVNGAMLYDRSKMEPLYMLRIGHAGSSFAIEIARKIGLPQDVVDYAQQTVGKGYVMSDKYLQDIARDKMYWETKRAKVHSREKELDEAIATYEHELEELKSRKKAVIAQAKEEAEELLKASNAQIEKTIKDIKEAQAEKERTKAARQELSEFKESLESSGEETSTEAQAKVDRQLEKIKRYQERKRQKRERASNAPASPQAAPAVAAAPAVEIAAGDFVRLKGQQTVGKVESVNGGVARILFGIMHTSVNTDRLEKAAAPQKDDTLSKVSTFVSRETRDAIYEKKLNFKPEIDLRGLRGQEALEAVSRFIDDALLVEQKRVRILHGTGTGALRQLIRQYLNSAIGVAKFYDEHVQFGGAGITIVELK